MQALFISALIGDATVCCGAAIATARHATVVTVFTGGGPDDDAAMRIRRGDDYAALTVLDAQPVWLGASTDADEDRDRLIDIIGGYVNSRLVRGEVWAPLGGGQRTARRAVSEACLALAAVSPWIAWRFYDDCFGTEKPGRLAELAARGHTMTEADPSPWAGTVKLRAYRRYVDATDGWLYAKVGEPERSWHHHYVA